MLFFQRLWRRGRQIKIPLLAFQYETPQVGQSPQIISGSLGEPECVPLPWTGTQDILVTCWVSSCALLPRQDPKVWSGCLVPHETFCQTHQGSEICIPSRSESLWPCRSPRGPRMCTLGQSPQNLTVPSQGPEMRVHFRDVMPR